MTDTKEPKKENKKPATAKQETPVTDTAEQTQGMKAKLNATMAELQEQNPMASWKNLFLGVSVVVLVILSSMIYFNKLAANAIVEDATKEVETTVPLNKAKEEKQPGRKTNTEQQPQTEDVFTTVLDGEGLWNVAERVCDSGEKYVILAQANGLDSEAAVNPGQRLLVKCD